MNCPNCRKELIEKKYKGVMLHRCQSCDGFWFESGEFEEAMENEDQFLKWSDLDLWKEDAHHALKARAEACPSCSENLYEVEYKGHSIHPWICVSCRGVWMRKNEIKKIIKYLEDQLDSQTLKDFLKHLGKEAADVLTHENIGDQFKDLKMVLKLINYRLFSKFPILDKFARNLPKP